MTSNSLIRRADSDAGGKADIIEVKTKKAASKIEEKNAANLISKRANSGKKQLKKVDASAKTTSLKTNSNKKLKKYDFRPAEAQTSFAGGNGSRVRLATVGVFGLLIGFLVGKNIK